jgi:hypothetical protein
VAGKTSKRELAKQRSQYEILVRESLNTMSRYLTMHRPCTDFLEFQEGSIIEDIRRRGRLRRHHVLAWAKWWAVVCAAHGSTGGMTVSYQERVDTSLPVDPLSEYSLYFNNSEELERAIDRSKPYIYLTSAADEYARLWEWLRHEERGLIEQLTRDYHRASGHRDVHASTLTTLGMVMSGYSDNRQSISAGVSRVQACLNSVAEFYRFPIMQA